MWHLPGLGVNNNGWVGEGRVKFYLDGDGEFPTLCGTAPRTISAVRTLRGKERGGYASSHPYTV